MEQEYPKKFNLPDAQFEAYYRKPKPQRIYSHLRMVLSPEGEIILLDKQDRSKWNSQLIEEGNNYMNRAAFGNSRPSGLLGLTTIDSDAPPMRPMSDTCST